MNKIIPYIVGCVLVVFATLPPIDFKIVTPGEYWPWMVMIFSFAGVFISFLKVNPVIKVIAIFGLINCFYTKAPVISFIAYFSLVTCCYFYILCSMIKDYRPVFKMLQCLLFLHAFMFLMQWLGKDPFLNFSKRECFGIIGQHMQSASFSVILAATLMPYNVCNISFPFITSFLCNSAGALLSAGFGIVAYTPFIKDKRFIMALVTVIFISFIAWMASGKFLENISPRSGRLTMWIESIKLANEHPVMGWGIGTYQYIFPAFMPKLGLFHSIPWKTAHNALIQMAFECGFFFTYFFIGYYFSIITRLIRLMRRDIFRKKALACLSGIMMIGINSMIHFPDRMIQTVPLIIFFISYCEGLITMGKVSKNYAT